MKMEEINKIIRDLWRSTYRGQGVSFLVWFCPWVSIWCWALHTQKWLFKILKIRGLEVLGSKLKVPFVVHCCNLIYATLCSKLQDKERWFSLSQASQRWGFLELHEFILSIGEKLLSRMTIFGNWFLTVSKLMSLGSSVYNCCGYCILHLPTPVNSMTLLDFW